MRLILREGLSSILIEEKLNCVGLICFGAFLNESLKSEPAQNLHELVADQLALWVIAFLLPEGELLLSSCVASYECQIDIAKLYDLVVNQVVALKHKFGH